MNERKKLENERSALTHRFVIGGKDRNKGYVTVGFYEDGSPGEIFVKMDSQGSQVSGFVDAWAISVSMLLQMGMPLSTICDKFRGSRFEPAGVTDNPNIRIAQSPIDYIARWLEMKFVDTELAEEPAVESKVCANAGCSSGDRVFLHNGKLQCVSCRSGRAS